MGGGGGDGGYEARQAATEASKAEARRRLNAQFGEGAAGDVDRSKYTTTEWISQPGAPSRAVAQYGGEGDSNSVESIFAIPAPEARTTFDQAGYDDEVAMNNGIAPNKAAREKLYGTVRDNAFAAGRRGLDENRERTQRDLRFELFAKGLNGGSEDINQNAMLGRTYDQGILDLGAKADAAATGMRVSDEQTRLNLLQGIDSGMDQSSVLSSAANQLSNNSAAAAAEAQGTSLGDLFANAGLLNQQSQYRQGKAAGTDWWNTLTPSGSMGKTKSSTGTVTQS